MIPGPACNLVPILGLREIHKRTSIHLTMYQHAGFLLLLGMLIFVNKPVLFEIKKFKARPSIEDHEMRQVSLASCKFSPSMSGVPVNV